MTRITLILLSTLCLYIASCKSKSTDKSSTDKIEHRKLEIDTDSFNLLELPLSKNNVLDKSHICYDVYDNQEVDLPSNIQKLGLSYFSFTFDTIINRTKLIYSYRIVSGGSKTAINYRIFDHLKNEFPAMAESVSIEPKNNSCLYSQLTDSVEMKGDKLIYTRYDGTTYGGAGAMESLKKYSLSKTELQKILMDSNLIINDNYLNRYLIKESYF